MKFKKKLKTFEYPHIKKLGLEIHNEPTSHIKSKELDAALKKAKINRKKFSEYFGCQTCLLCDDGQTGLFPYDVEAVLVRMLEKGRLTGTQLWMD